MKPLLVRFGLVIVTAFSMEAVVIVFTESPIAFQPSAWYFSAGLFGLAIIAAITLYGFRTSLGSRRLLNVSRVGD